MSLLDIAVFVATMRYTYVELTSMEQQQRQRLWRRIAPHKRFVTSMLFIGLGAYFMISVEFLFIEGFLSFAYLETEYVADLLMFTV